MGHLALRTALKAGYDKLSAILDCEVSECGALVGFFLTEWNSLVSLDAVGESLSEYNALSGNHLVL